jgi:predicted RNA-binding Zn-ribbon protein involved in translation (DUF1610 family)
MSGGAIPTPCPSCGLKLSLAPEHHGKEVHCPECGTLFVSGTDQVISRGALDTAASPPTEPVAPTMSCPYCAEEILATARKCKYCSEWLQAEPPPEPDPEPAVVGDASAAQRLHSQGTTAFVLSLIGLLGGLACAPIGILTIIGLILGATTNSGLRKLGQPYSGLATAAVIIGALALVILLAVFVLIFVAAAAPYPTDY